MCTTSSSNLPIDRNADTQASTNADTDDDHEDYSHSSDEEKGRNNEDESTSNGCEDVAQMICLKKNCEETLTTFLRSKVATNIFVENSTNVDIGNKIIFNQANVDQIEALFEVLLKQRSQGTQEDIGANFPMVSRLRWLAVPSTGTMDYMKEPAKYVIIAHTATEEGFDQAQNTLIIKTIQTYHTESLHWFDIGYNFLAGSDGNIYEGRGWNVCGAHTSGYNSVSVGIAFIGCFIERLPPKSALEKCQALIAYGVQNGYIREDYQLLAHRQCRPFRSPGDRLFQELKTWKNWNPNISIKDPPPRRGWNVCGVHTSGYNAVSVGIAFVGCFIDHLPPKSALEKCQALIAYGVQSGYIREDYQLLAHRQCQPFESPGEKLFQELKSWKHWNPNISIRDPPPNC